MTDDLERQKKLRAKLVEAIVECDPGMVAEALRLGVSANSRTFQGISMLTMAAGAGSLESVRLLVEAGANVNRRDMVNDSEFRTPLHNAIYQAHIDIIDLLLSHGADPRLINQNGENAVIAFLDANVLKNFEKEDSAPALKLLAQMLLVKGTVNKIDTHGRTSLRVALDKGAPPEVIDLLFAHGADPTIRTSEGTSAVHQIWSADSIWKMHCLVANGADLNTPDWEGASALAYAVDAYAVSELVAAGARLDLLDDMGRNALAIIVDRERNQVWSTEAMTQLIASGIDTQQRDYSGASVESRLSEIDSDRAKQMLALIGANKAQQAISRVVKASANRPA